jgi:hypothetical protein
VHAPTRCILQRLKKDVFCAHYVLQRLVKRNTTTRAKTRKMAL